MLEKLEITVGTHFFQVRPGTNAKYVGLCMGFVRRFLKVDVQGQTRTITTFASANKERTWFRFHINSFQEFDKHLFMNGVGKEQVTVLYLPEPVVDKCEMKVREGWTVREDQEPILDYLTSEIGKRDDNTNTWVDGGPRARLVGIQTGKGKAFPVDVLVRTPDGTRRNGDLVKGDIVLAWDGTPTAVKNVYPQGKVCGYEVKTCDGRKLITSEDHLWGVYLGGNLERITIATKDINAMLDEWGSVRIDLPQIGSEEEHTKLKEIIDAHATGKKDELGCSLLKTESLETAKEWRDLARACGARVTLLEVNGAKHLLFITPRGDSFSNNTLALMRVKDTMQDYEMQCIEIDHPDRLFIAGDYIVTHNTFCALKAISDLGYKIVVIVLAQFVEKWAGGYDKVEKKVLKGDITQILEIEPDEILKVQGGASMQALTQMALTEGSMDKFKAVVISNRTFENYLRAYENFGSEMDTMGYMVTPDELWVKLGVGIRLIDEVHMHFHSNFRVDLYTHVLRSISLSATLKTRDESLNKMYRVAYPPNERFKEGPLDKFADSYGVVYGIPDGWNYKTTHRGTSNYNHTAFEASVLKSKDFTQSYANMFAHYLDIGFKANYKPGNKFILFAASVEMCTKLTEILQKKFPEYSIKRYVAGDPYKDNYLEPDGRVTTIGSGGTGHDIKGITDNHLGTAIDSLQSNIQAFGRSRKPLDGQQTRFWFYSCEDIQKHMGYHLKKKDLMAERARSYSPLYYGVLGGSRYCT